MNQPETTLTPQQQIELYEANLRQIDLHTRALSTQIQSAEEFYYNDCTQGNLLRGWDPSNFSSAQLKQKGTPMPDAVKVFSGCSVNVPGAPSTPALDDTPALYQDVQTIMVHKSGSVGLVQGGYQPTGPIKRTM